MFPLPNLLDSHGTSSTHHEEDPLLPTMSCVVNVQDFSSKSYWDHRFASESSFEWLQPSSSILPAITSELQTHWGSDVRILHLGSGSSDLSNQLRRLLVEHYGCTENLVKTQSLILNVDFSPAAIEIGRRREREEFGDDRTGAMHWAVVDLLNWAVFRRTCEEHSLKLFDMIVEKSCTDALACGADVQLGQSCGTGEELSSIWESNVHSVTPEVALAAYLAAVTRPGAAWIALSYSRERFDFLRDAGQSVARMWSIERVQTIRVEECSEPEAGKTVYRPEIVHYVYIIRRLSSERI